ncbi:glycoside hydrolase family 3 N-terminal domain-containing protein [Allorhizocola rhizosphaerae]|uniref:beta-xylosidase/alpha-l-arabinosidase n=1 Tax=Allorhizocola rhizosphaerae TaxID=1872709 RepID=UPI000E3C42D3|nr:glycoside hydrolase family 3 N-terminal domain-containing protein [Allorhizocola rhizosphaerae]
MTMEPWRDPSRPVDERVADLMRRMTLAEKIAQLYSAWVGGGNDPVAPEGQRPEWDWHQLIEDGLGQLTRVFGTAPVTPEEGVLRLAGMQEAVVKANRFGIPAIAHEECLSGFTTLSATIFPTPLAWGATFDPDLVRDMAALIGRSLKTVGVQQGLAPLLDVTRDPRWGRTEETIGEDPYLVATIGTAYVQGLQSAGVVATLKHFAGYSGSRAGRNFAPVSMGRREFMDVVLPPFEMAVRDGRARSVMHSYSEVDGVPAASDTWLLTDLLRGEWGFTGTVVADYFGITFLQTWHGVAADIADAARIALGAGVDVELPNALAYLTLTDRELVDRACERVLRQKCELGLLDPDWAPPTADGDIDLDPPEARELARRVAEESVVLLANDGTLPLRDLKRLAVVGPLADDPNAMFGCYTFPRHVGLHHPGTPIGVDAPTVLQALRQRLPGADIVHSRGCDVRELATSGFADAVAAASRAEACVMVLGDVAGLFQAGTSGEGSDVADLELPGVQSALLDAVLSTGTPLILVLMSGRPYALGRFADRTAGIIQAFFPGQAGGAAVASVLTGDVCPSGRLPVSLPHDPGGQPWTYLMPKLGYATDVSSVDPTPLFPFGHGLSYTSFDCKIDKDHYDVGTGDSLAFRVEVRNVGPVAGAEVVQIYLRDPVASVTRPLVRLIGYARVELEPGQTRRVEFEFHPDLACFTGRDGRRVVEPGLVELRVSASSQAVHRVITVNLVGDGRVVGHERRLTMGVSIADG